MNRPTQHLSSPTLAQLRRRLLAWYGRNQRDLPWRRRSSDPYAQLLAELMLQQTQVTTVIPYFERFLARFPTVADLAAADIDEVLALWSGLGYYRRARHLHAAAQRIVDDYQGIIPADVQTLMSLPGIGRYTAGAIASIAYDTRAAILDGNVTRVLMRLLAMCGDPTSPRLQRRLWETAETLLPARRCGAFNQALMELGATICRPQSPVCPSCPLASICLANSGDLVERIPPVKKRAKIGSAAYVVAAVQYGNRMLFVQRPMTGLWAGLWELPAELVQPHEVLPSARRRLLKRLPANCRLSETVEARTTRQLTHRTITFHIYAGHAAARRAVPDAARWLNRADLTGVGLSRATGAILELLKWL